MRAVCGTGKQEFGAKNIVFYAFLSVQALFEHSPKIDMYIAHHGRIVTKCGLPSSTVTKVRKNDDMGTKITNPMQAPPPSAPAGSHRVRSRDSMGGSPVPAGSNYTDLPVPDRRIVTKHSNVKLRIGHHSMLPRMTTGTAWQQHRQLQMFKGVYKTTQCDYEFRGCQKGSQCCFAHTMDNPREIDAEVMPLRFKVYRRLFDEGFSLPYEIRHEIGQMSDEDFEKEMLKKDLYQERVDERIANAAAERSQRPRMHDSSKSPRSSQSDRDSRTPDPNRRRGLPVDYDELIRNKNNGKGKGDVSALMEVDDDFSARQRDLTSGGADEDGLGPRGGGGRPHR